MPGLLSNVFGQGSDNESQTSQQSDQYDAAGDADLALSPSIGVEHDASGSYQNLDGSTTEWSSDTDVTLTVDVDAALGAVGSLDQASIADAG